MWWQISTADPGQMLRCLHPLQASSPAPDHQCHRAVPRSGNTPISCTGAPDISTMAGETSVPPFCRAEFIRGKHGVEIVSEYDQGNGQIRFPVALSETKTFTVQVQNHGAEAVTMHHCHPLHRVRELSFMDEQGVTQNQALLLHPGTAWPHSLLPQGRRMQPQLSPPSQVVRTPSRSVVRPDKMGSSVPWWCLNSARSWMGPSASGAPLLPLLRASWPRSWDPRRPTGPTRPVCSAPSLSSPRTECPPSGTGPSPTAVLC